MSPAGREQRYEYNVLGHLVALQVGGQSWRFEYDTAGRLPRFIDPTGCESTFAYDGVTAEVLGSAAHAADDDPAVRVRVTVTNTGERAGGEVLLRGDDVARGGQHHADVLPRNREHGAAHRPPGQEKARRSRQFGRRLQPDEFLLSSPLAIYQSIVDRFF